jgi:type IV pilus assembly protein PilE
MLNTLANNKPARGITLMELMVVLAILALLLLAALPSYTRYIQRTHRSEAVEALLNEAMRQERSYLVSRQFKDRTSFETSSGHYLISVELIASGSGYELEAQPLGSQENDQCGVLKLDNKGRKSSAGDPWLCWDGRG